MLTFNEDQSALNLADGGTFPSLGLGTWKIPQERAPQIIQDAIRIGYRHFDCACDYGNELEVGAGLRGAMEGGRCTRDDLWITSKLWNTYHEPQHVRAACERSLRDLGLDELDLYLVHFPIALAYVPFEERYPPGWLFDPKAESPAMKPIKVPYSDTWGAMEELQQAGLVKRIGVSNLTISLLREVLSSCAIRPAVHQIELHPYLTQQKMLRYCQEEDVAITAFSPLGADSYLSLGMAGEEERLLTNSVMTSIAAHHEKSAAQIALRWALQRGTAPIPKTQSIPHLEENLAIYDFALSGEDLSQIDALDQHRRFNDPGEFGEKAFNTFIPIYD
ncbi:MAG: aldo/keto reductase [Roseibacillus sp.]|nr:aldo/keto reductase [Roseibacillus sp.]